MRKKFQQIGNSFGIIFPKAILELLNINPVLDEAEIKVVDNEIRIKKAEPENSAFGVGEILHRSTSSL